MDNSTRLYIAYGLMLLIALVAAGAIAWHRHNSFDRRNARDRGRREKIYRQRAAAVKAANAAKAAD